MTVATTNNFNTGTGDGATTIFPFTFAIQQASDMQVYLNQVVQGGGYTVNINTPSFVGGNVTFAAPPANGVAVFLQRAVPLTQQTALPVEGKFDEATLEKMSDKAMMACQQLKENIDRCVQVPVGTVGVSLALPSPTALYVLRWNAGGNALESVSPAQAFNDSVPAGGGGNVLGPVSSTNRGIAFWNGTNGQNLKSTGVGTIGQPLLSGGASVDPAYSNLALAGAATNIFGVGTTGDTNPRIVMDTDGKLSGGPGNAAVDISLQRTATKTFSLVVGSGVPTLNMNSGPIIKTNLAVVNHGRAYAVASSPYQDSGGSGTLRFGPGAEGNFITLQDSNGNLVTQTFSEATISVGSSGTVAADLEVKSASDTTVSLTLTNWSGINTPPTRQLDNAGRLCKNGDPTKLIVASVYIQSNLVIDATNSRTIRNRYNQFPKPVFVAGGTGASVGSGTPTSIGLTVQWMNIDGLDPQLPYTFSGIVTQNTASNIAILSAANDSTTTPSFSANFQAYTGGALGNTASSGISNAGAGVKFIAMLLNTNGSGTAAVVGTNTVLIEAPIMT